MRNERRLDLIICMRKAENVGGDIDRTGLETASRNVLGVEIPLITVPVAPGPRPDQRGRSGPRSTSA